MKTDTEGFTTALGFEPQDYMNFRMRCGLHMSSN